MLVSIFIALFLTCSTFTAVFLVYICLLCCKARHNNTMDLEAGEGGEGKSSLEKGLSSSDLEKLPQVKGKDLVLGNDCAVCLDEIENEQEARLVPGCNHGFHIKCADTWLAKNPICPICRAKLPPELFSTIVHHLQKLSQETPC